MTHKTFLLALAAFGFVEAGAAHAYEPRLQVMVDPNRMGQCGDNFFATGGSDTYRVARILADGKPLGEYDLAQQSDCTKVLEYFVDLPADGKATITVEVGGYSMAAPVSAADRNRVYAVKFFVDTIFGELTEDFAAAFARALASGTGAVLDLDISPEALTPRQTLSQMRAAAFPTP